MLAVFLVAAAVRGGAVEAAHCCGAGREVRSATAAGVVGAAAVMGGVFGAAAMLLVLLVFLFPVGRAQSASCPYSSESLTHGG